MAELSPEAAPYDPYTMGGSMKRKIVNPALIEERARCSFSNEEAYHVAYPADQREEMGIYDILIKKHP
jgi:hypothetical protein